MALVDGRGAAAGGAGAGEEGERTRHVAVGEGAEPALAVDRGVRAPAGRCLLDRPLGVGAGMEQPQGKLLQRGALEEEAKLLEAAG